MSVLVAKQPHTNASLQALISDSQKQESCLVLTDSLFHHFLFLGSFFKKCKKTKNRDDLIPCDLHDSRKTLCL